MVNKPLAYGVNKEWAIISEDRVRAGGEKGGRVRLALSWHKDTGDLGGMGQDACSSQPGLCREWQTFFFFNFREMGLHQVQTTNLATG